ncbi:MAG: Electron transport complex subunit RnfG [Pseudomonadota bacterium]|jgi:Na+-translocating ferredoxin:NAD+ oxidoreductase RnfG subunit
MKWLILLMVFLSGIAQAEELISMKDYLKKELSGYSKLTKESFALSVEQKAEFGKVAPNSDEESYTFFFGKTAEGQVEKACTIVAQKGKEGPISLGVCFDPKGLLQSVTVLSHEEERGRRITEESFLKQFKGKKATDAFVLGADVDGISGATYSSKAISEALRKSAFAFKTFVK